MPETKDITNGPVTLADVQAYCNNIPQDHASFSAVQGFLAQAQQDPAQAQAMLMQIQQLVPNPTANASSQSGGQTPVTTSQFYEGLEEKKATAEKFLTEKLHEQVVVPAFSGDGQAAPLPADTRVELQPSVNNGVSEVEVRVTSKHMGVVGEKQMGDAVLKLLSEVPELQKNFNFSKTDAPEDTRPKPSEVSSTEDKSTISVKFSGQEAGPLLESIVAMRDGKTTETPPAPTEPKFADESLRKPAAASLGSSAVERSVREGQGAVIAV